MRCVLTCNVDMEEVQGVIICRRCRLFTLQKSQTSPNKSKLAHGVKKRDADSKRQTLYPRNLPCVINGVCLFSASANAQFFGGFFPFGLIPNPYALWALGGPGIGAAIPDESLEGLQENLISLPLQNMPDAVAVTSGTTASSPASCGSTCNSSIAVTAASNGDGSGAGSMTGAGSGAKSKTAGGNSGRLNSTADDADAVDTRSVNKKTSGTLFNGGIHLKADNKPVDQRKILVTSLSQLARQSSLESSKKGTLWKSNNLANVSCLLCLFLEFVNGFARFFSIAVGQIPIVFLYCGRKL